MKSSIMRPYASIWVALGSRPSTLGSSLMSKFKDLEMIPGPPPRPKETWPPLHVRSLNSSRSI